MELSPQKEMMWRERENTGSKVLVVSNTHTQKKKR
jgi:hypothetical protein